MGPVERLLEAFSRVRGWYPVTIAGRTFRCDPDHISFWSRVSHGAWEPETFKILNRLLHPGAVYCDMGAWIGPTVLHAAAQAGQVYCFEPDRVAYMYLLRNLKLNRVGNVLPFNLALAPRNGVCTMASPRGKWGDSMTSLLNPEGEQGMEVLCLSWSSWLDILDTPVLDCIKMDIEGAEFALLPEMREYLIAYRPRLYLSLHPHLLPKEKRSGAMHEVVELLGAIYGICSNQNGEVVDIQSLMEEQVLNRAGSYLLLPQ